MQTTTSNMQDAQSTPKTPDLFMGAGSPADEDVSAETAKTDASERAQERISNDDPFTPEDAPIAQRAVLVTLSISAFGGTMKDVIATRQIHERHGIEDATAGKYTKRILQPAVKAIKKHVSKARNRHYEITLPYDRQGFALLPNALVMQYTREMRDLFDAIDEEIEAQIERLPELIERDRKKLNGLFKPSDYPTPDEFRTYYNHSFNFFPLQDGNSLWPQWEADAMNDEAKRLREEMREAIDVETTAEIERAMRSVWQRTYDAVKKMADKLDAYGTNEDGRTVGIFRDSLVENVRELADLLPKMNIAGDERLAELSRKIRQDLTKYDADALRDSDGQRQDVARKAAKIAKDMSAFMSA